MKSFDYSISSVRIISLLLIIICHILQGLEYELAFWFNIGVQIFFFISGYLYGSKDIEDIKNYYLKRIKKILLPLSILVIVMLIIEYVFTNNTYSFNQILINVFGLGGVLGTLKTLSHTWFVTYILICYLITPILQKIFSSKKADLWLLVGLIFACVLIQKSDSISQLFTYVFGYYYTRCCTAYKKKNAFFITFILLALLLLPLNIITRYNLINDFPMFLLSNSNIIHAWEHSFIGIILFICLYKAFTKVKIPEFILKFSDKYSFFIYLTHQIFILGNFSILFLTNYLTINILIILLASVVSGVLLYRLYISITKLLSKPFKTLLSQKTEM